MTDQNIKQVIATFVIIVLALALTPTIAAFVTDANYQSVTETFERLPSAGGGNTTVLANDARNDSATYAYLKIVLNATNVYGVKVVDMLTGITLDPLNTITFTNVLNKTVWYTITVSYYTSDLTSAANVALIAVIPVIWVVVILAVGIVAISYQLKKRG